jgi:cell division protein FtsI (penicillin-binding protein 3)
VGRTVSRLRLFLVATVLVSGSVALVGRLGYWQLVEGERLAAQGRAQTTVEIVQPARRGTIFDRSGTVALAMTVDRYRLVADPASLTQSQRAAVADRLVGLLGLQGTAAEDLRSRLDKDRSYVVLADGLAPSVADAIRSGLEDGTLLGLSLESEPTRVYPQAGGGPDTSLAAQLIGFVNRQGQGQYGVEQAYQAVLAGSPQVILAQRDAAGDPVPDTIRIVQPGVPGQDLRLTIDAGLQLALEQECLAAWIADRAAFVSALVMDPYSGEIYAYGSAPSYDANAYAAVAASDPGRLVDPISGALYEPGSVFKMFTAVAALEAGVVTPATKVDDSGSLRLDGGRTQVNDADRRAMGWISFADVIAYSRNVGAARVALSLAPTTRAASVRLFDTWTRFGFGRPTGIDLAGEASGLLRDPTIATWRQIDLANAAFGQGVAVTQLQLATAYAAMINGGTLVTPHVVAAVGSRTVDPPPRATALISPQLSATLVDLLRHVVTAVPFYAKGTLISGYDVGGKTGTAQIWDPQANGGRGGWKSLFNHSFVGFVGKGRPQLLIAVRISEPHPTIARIGFIDLPVQSFELFRRIAVDALARLDVIGHPSGRPASPSPPLTSEPTATPETTAGSPAP